MYILSRQYRIVAVLRRSPEEGRRHIQCFHVAKIKQSPPPSVNSCLTGTLSSILRQVILSIVRVAQKILQAILRTYFNLLLLQQRFLWRDQIHFQTSGSDINPFHLFSVRLFSAYVLLNRISCQIFILSSIQTVFLSLSTFLYLSVSLTSPFCFS